MMFVWHSMEHHDPLESINHHLYNDSLFKRKRNKSISNGKILDKPFGSGIVEPQPFVECVPDGKVEADKAVALLHSNIFPSATSHRSIRPSGDCFVVKQ